MGVPARGSIVIIPFPFSDLTGVKLRPAVVLASAGLDDWIMAQITSRNWNDKRALLLRPDDFALGGLPRVSYIRPAKLFTAGQGLIRADKGRLNRLALARALKAAADSFRL